MDCAESCPMTTFPDNRQVCHPCATVGCNTCSEQDGCKECLIFHLPLSSGPNGQCLFIFGGVFLAVFLVALSLCLIELLRFCCMGLLTPRNPGVLKEVLAHRRRAKAHDYSLPGNPFYGYDDTNVRRQSVSGLGPLLYFRFVAFQALMALLVGLALGAGHLLPQMSEGSEAAFLPELIGKEQLDLVMTVHAVCVYVVGFIVVVNWVFGQDQAVRTSIEEEPHLRNYALVGEGFPKSARSAHEVKAFFESILGFELEGVSIAYDHIEEVDFVRDRVSRAVEKADTHLGVYPSELSGLESHVGESQDGYVLDCLMCSGYAFVVFSREEDREFCLRRFGEIERQVQRGWAVSREEADSEDEEAQALLKTGPGRGRGPRPGAAGELGGVSRAVLFRGKFPIRMGHAPEPCGVQWQHFALRRGAKLVRAGLSLLTAVLLVTVVGAVAFAPAVLYEMSYIDIASPTKSQQRLAVLEQAVSVFSITVGCRLLTRALRRAARGAGFLQKVNEDCDLTVSALLTTLLAVAVPLLVSSAVAAPSTEVTRSLALRWLFQSLWMDILVTEVDGFLTPTWRYWSSYFWVRQNKYVSVREAEPALTTADFPLAERYVDSLRALTLVWSMVSLDCTSMYTAGAQFLLLAYCVYVYFVDKYTFLRVHRQTYYTSPKLDTTVHYLFAIPLAILAILPLQRFSFGTRPWLVPTVLAGSIVLYLGLVRLSQKCSEPRRELTEIPYIEVASLLPYNYFNTNPVHVLRSLHFPSIVVPPIYPFLPGKEYLQGGQFADYDDSIRLRETLMLLAKTPLKGLDLGNPQDFG
uniref:CSC1/OSCA1-like cytosolic domain-containing protein n=1 Tax=Alexandrium monilatum TaxID=311494 RepID=A0A7S4V312_9DINO